MTEEAEIQRMTRFLEVEAGVFCSAGTESLVASKADIDAFVLIL